MTTGAKIAIIAFSVLLIGGGIFGYLYLKKKEQKELAGQGIKEVLDEGDIKQSTNAKLTDLKQQKPIKETVAMPSNYKELSRK